MLEKAQPTYVQFFNWLYRKHRKLLVTLTYDACSIKMRRVKTPSCRKCDAEKETFVHILCECLALEKDRTESLGRAQMDLDELKKMRQRGFAHCKPN